MEIHENTRLCQKQECFAWWGDCCFCDMMLHTRGNKVWLEILEKSKYRLYLQPILDICSNQVIGYEVLSRQHDVDTELFFKMAAKNDRTYLVDSTILQQVLPLVGRMEIPFFINIYLSTLFKFPFSLYDCSRVIFELTEQEEMSDASALSQAIANLGLKIAIDDFGAGYSNLNRLIELKSVYIKLNRKLIDHIDGSKDKQDLVKALHSYSKDRFSVIAEGIERAEELHTVKELGITLGQGYLLGKPKLWKVLY